MPGFSFQFDHYQVEKDREGNPVVLGGGAMGITYLAVDTRLERKVALKTVSAALPREESRDYFLREARAAARIEHPHVASVLYFGERDGEFFYTMPFCDGPTLLDRVRASGPLTDRECLGIGKALASALVAVEEAGLVHRDIKPQNIILLERGAVLIDFGLARTFDTHVGPEQLGQITRPDIQFVGTPEFCSPEQARNLPLDIRSDIYSLGATLWFALLGEPPIPCPGGLPLPVVTESPDWQQLHTGIDPRLVRLLLVTLEKESDDRPEDASALLALFEETGTDPVPVPVDDAAGSVGGESIRTPVAGNPGDGDKPVGADSELLQSDAIRGALRPEPGRPVHNSIGLKLIGIGAGIFPMGDPAGKKRPMGNEDYHRVEISEPFWMGVLPVTREEYVRICGGEIPDGGESCPVTGISWKEAEEFCSLLTKHEAREGWLPLGYTYSLPTEAQWEFTCRAGTATPFSTGDTLPDNAANYRGEGVTPVGSFPPNPWGLYDMHGNVWELCRDSYRQHLGRSAQKDPFTPEPTTTVVRRGGSWRSTSAEECRSSKRSPEAKEHGAWDIGFRVALVRSTSK